MNPNYQDRLDLFLDELKAIEHKYKIVMITMQVEAEEDMYKLQAKRVLKQIQKLARNK